MKKILELSDKFTKFDEKNKIYYLVLVVPLLIYFITILGISSFINNTYITIINLFLFLILNIFFTFILFKNIKYNFKVKKFRTILYAIVAYIPMFMQTLSLLTFLLFKIMTLSESGNQMLDKNINYAEPLANMSNIYANFLSIYVLLITFSSMYNFFKNDFMFQNFLNKHNKKNKEIITVSWFLIFSLISFLIFLLISLVNDKFITIITFVNGFLIYLLTPENFYNTFSEKILQKNERIKDNIIKKFYRIKIFLFFTNASWIVSILAFPRNTNINKILDNPLNGRFIIMVLLFVIEYIIFFIFQNKISPKSEKWKENNND